MILWDKWDKVAAAGDNSGNGQQSDGKGNAPE
jgi:hypothetical protein